MPWPNGKGVCLPSDAEMVVVVMVVMTVFVVAVLALLEPVHRRKLEVAGQDAERVHGGGSVCRLQ